MQPSSNAAVARFGSFELDLNSGELRKSGLRVRLPQQPFQILVMLIERRGELVAREELRLRLWPEDTFVDFERCLNRAVNKLREALCDSADVPRFVETLPRRGYRFIMPVLFAGRAASSSNDAGLPRSIAVLPFTNASGLDDADYLCDGIAETLIYNLAE